MRLWHELAARAGLTLDAAAESRLREFLDRLAEANRTMNLTRIVEPEAAALHHVADALSALPLLREVRGAAADVGSGCGVPGIPLAIVRPDLRFTLIESVRKKAAFLSAVVHQLRLENVAVRAERAEALGRGELRGRLAAVTARAVAPLERLVEWCWDLLAPGGRLLAMKGPRHAEELEAGNRALAGRRAGPFVVEPAAVPGIEGHVICVAVRTGVDRTPSRRAS